MAVTKLSLYDQIKGIAAGGTSAAGDLPVVSDTAGTLIKASGLSFVNGILTVNPTVAGTVTALVRNLSANAAATSSLDVLDDGGLNGVRLSTTSSGAASPRYVSLASIGASQDLHIGTALGNVITIDGSNNRVGIGTTVAPQTPLEVQFSVAGATGLLLGNSSASANAATRAEIQCGSDISLIAWGDAGANAGIVEVSSDDAYTEMRFKTAGAIPFVFKNGTTELARVASTGIVSATSFSGTVTGSSTYFTQAGLITTISDAATNNTTHKASGYIAQYASIWNGAAAATKGVFHQVGGISGTNTAYQLNFASSDVSNILVLRGDNGNIGIGTNPSYRLHIITTTASDQAVRAIHSATSGSNYALVGICNGATPTLNVGAYVSASGATTNRALVITGTTAAATNHAIYCDAAAQVYFAGLVGIGTDAPDAMLTFAANSSQHFLGSSASVYALPASGYVTYLDLVAGSTSFGANGAGIRIDSAGASALGTISFATNKAGVGSGTRMTITTAGVIDMQQSIIAHIPVNIPLSNGANNNVTLPDGEFLVITSLTAVADVTGMVPAQNGHKVSFTNATGYAVTFKYNSGSSTAANRMLINGGADIVLNSYDSATFQYNASIWYCTATSRT